MPGDFNFSNDCPVYQSQLFIEGIAAREINGVNYGRVVFPLLVGKLLYTF